VLVVDAVDEADRPGDLVAQLLVPLATATVDDGGSVCRMLVAGRSESHLDLLLERARSGGGLMDLGAVRRDEVRPAMRAYLLDLFGHGTSAYARWEYAEAGEALAGAIAQTLRADRVAAPIRRRCSGGSSWWRACMSGTCWTWTRWRTLTRLVGWGPRCRVIWDTASPVHVSIGSSGDGCESNSRVAAPDVLRITTEVAGRPCRNGRLQRRRYPGPRACGWACPKCPKRRGAPT
jgi:hypothetical protein